MDNPLQFMKDTIEGIRPLVKTIENDPMSLTKGNYGAYLRLVSLPDCPNVTVAKYMALCLITAGANRQGVLNALAIAWPETKNYLDDIV